MSLVELRAQAQKWKQDVNSHFLPGTVLYEFYSRTPKHLQVQWGIKEGENDGTGIGIYPILEGIGHTAKTPTRSEIEAEMVELLRNFVDVANISKAKDLIEKYGLAELPDLMKEEDAIKQKLTWPRFKAAATTNQGNMQGKGPTTTTGSAQLSMKPTRTGKYSAENGLYNEEDLEGELQNVPSHLRQVLVKHANASLSYQTWRAVKGVRRRIRECEMETEAQLNFPWSEEQTNTFTAWCLDRELREQTIKNYLSKVTKK